MGKRISYDPYDHFMLRAPLFPLVLLSSIPGSPDQLIQWLKELWKNPLIREGIFLGSTEFSERVEQEFSQGFSALPDHSLLCSLLRYICRFSSRCTPFGIFAGFSTGTTGPGASVRIGEADKHQLHARPDMEYLMGIARLLEKEYDIREKLVYTGNTSLYPIGSRWHYVEAKIPAGKSRKVYDIITIDDQGVILNILEFCRNGKRLNEIRDFLQQGGRQLQEVNDFVESLVEAQVLVSNLEPVVCGPEYLDYMMTVTEREFDNNDIAVDLKKLKEIFDQINKPGTVSDNLKLLEPLVDKLHINLNRNHLIQVDMKLSCEELSVNAEVTGQIILGLRIIKSLASPAKTDVLKGFREAFIKRYGDRKVLLVNVLDPETGIGLEGVMGSNWTDPAPWIDDLGWGPSIPSPLAPMDPGNSWLSGKLYQVIRDGSLYLTLESPDLQSIGIHQGEWPAQMSAMVELFEKDETGEINIHLLMGTSGNPAFLLGRFGFADSNITGQWIRQLMEDEKLSDPDSVFAEVVHLPEDRIGNVLQRPAFLDFEIPYLAASTKHQNFQIPITDLLLSLENQRFVLSSVTLGKRIRPCMTNAYNHQLGHLGIYKFLNRIRFQEPEISFSPHWGDQLKQAPFIPGIRFKNLILSPPVWLIRCEEISAWIHFEKKEIDMPELTGWRNARQMPDEMLWMAADQELYLNWTNRNLILSFWDTVRNHTYIKLRPFFLSKGTPVRSKDGSHANQFVFCFRKS